MWETDKKVEKKKIEKKDGGTGTDLTDLVPDISAELEEIEEQTTKPDEPPQRQRSSCGCW